MNSPSTVPPKSKPAATTNGEKVDRARILPKDYHPNEEYTVVIGRGRKINARKGNQRMFKIVLDRLPKYAVTGCKNKKSAILVEIVNQIKDSDVSVSGPGGRGVGFAKLDSSSGRWYEVSMRTARTTVAQAFRDTNHNQYRSSKQSKQRRRRQKKIVARTVTYDSESSSSSTNSLTLRDAFFQERKVLCGEATTVGSKISHQSHPSSLDTFQTPSSTYHPCPPAEGQSNSTCPPQDPMLRLHNILEEAVRFADDPVTDEKKEDDDDIVQISCSAPTTTWPQPSHDHHGPSLFEPVPIAAAFDEFTTVVNHDDHDDDYPVVVEEEEDVFQVFDMFSVADIRAALSP